MFLKGINTALLSAAILFSGAAAAAPVTNGPLGELTATVEELSARVVELEAKADAAQSAQDTLASQVAELQAAAGVSASLSDLLSGSTFRMYWKDGEIGPGWTHMGMGTGYIVLNSDGTFAYPRYMMVRGDHGGEGLEEIRSMNTWNDLSVLGQWTASDEGSSLQLQFYGEDGVHTPGEDQRFWYQVAHNGSVLMSWYLDDNTEAGYFFSQYVAGVRLHESAGKHQ